MCSWIASYAATSAAQSAWSNHFLRRQLEVPLHLLLQRCERPVPRVDAVEDRRDVLRVRLPASLLLGELRLIAGLRGRDHVCGDEDV
jgi:hypothetical protein